jgi:hypothetical protein
MNRRGNVLLIILILIVLALGVFFLVKHFSTINSSSKSVEITLPSYVISSAVGRCSLLVQGQNPGTDNKEIACTKYCGDDNKEYDHYTCVTDHLHCFCKV